MDAAYVFRWNGNSWMEEQKLLASDGVEEDGFGTGLSISGDVALVGAPGDDEATVPGPGKVYVFRWNGNSWVEGQKLLASDGAAGDGFGGDESVCISGDVALVGADGDDDKGTDSGSAYVYKAIDICESDFELSDGDVDGSDLASYIADSAGISLYVFSADFGRTDCPSSD